MSYFEKRIIVINNEKCKPKTPAFDYLVSKSRICGHNCIECKYDRIVISDDACMICFNIAKRTPGDAVKVVKLPTNLSTTAVHRYGQNSFKLHGLPVPQLNSVLGLLGTNGIGKSTALSILSGDILPNLGNIDSIPTKKDIIKHYRGSILQNYFTQLYDDNLIISIKPQALDNFVISHHGSKLSELIPINNEVVEKLELNNLHDRTVESLSGGELQRLAICVTILKKADVYFFDEPTSFLDVKQRINVTELIRELNAYVIVVEHDLAILDYMSDYIQSLYGVPGVYGVVTQQTIVRSGINQFMDGYIVNENIRFRPYALNFKSKTDDTHAGQHEITYPDLFHQYPNNGFALKVESGSFKYNEITCLMGQNGCGKSTFMDTLANHFTSKLPISHKSQEITLDYKWTVQELLERKINYSLSDTFFRALVMKPLQIDSMKDRTVCNLSGGEKQRLAITICLGTAASIYFIDEPSASLDCEQRMIVSKAIRKYVIDHLGKACLLIEHDFLMSSVISDRIIVMEGTPGICIVANQSIGLGDGFNKFLKQLDVTFRRDMENGRPRINKRGSVIDQEQKKTDQYFIFE